MPYRRLEYYKRREADERHLAANTQSATVAAIRLLVAECYSRIIEAAEQARSERGRG